MILEEGNFEFEYFIDLLLFCLFVVIKEFFILYNDLFEVFCLLVKFDIFILLKIFLFEKYLL